MCVLKNQIKWQQLMDINNSSCNKPCHIRSNFRFCFIFFFFWSALNSFRFAFCLPESNKNLVINPSIKSSLHQIFVWRKKCCRILLWHNRNSFVKSIKFHSQFKSVALIHQIWMTKYFKSLQILLVSHFIMACFASKQFDF